MMGRPRALAAVLASVLVATPVMAQPRSPPQTDQQKQQLAGDLVKKAITRSQDGDHMGAIDLYLQAYSLIPQYTLLSNVGNEYQQAQKPVEALKYFCMYLEKDPTGTSATYAQVKAKALQIELGNKNVDDTDVCKPATRPPPPRRVEHDPPMPPPPASKSPLRWIGLGVAGLGAIGLGGGIYFGLKAKENSDFITDYRNDHPNAPWPDNIHDIEADGQLYENRQVQLLIAGGALVAAGVVLFVVGQVRSKPETVTIQPTASLDAAGVTITGGF